MDKQQKNVYPNQAQSVNYNMINPIHLQQAPQQYYQQLPLQQPMYYAASAPAYQPHPVPPQQFMMGPPPAYSHTAPSCSTYSIIPVAPITHQPSDPGWMNQATHKQSLLNESAGLRPPPMFHAAQPTGYVPMYNTPQTAIYDAGARFNGKNPPVIPPPPPGYLPNAAQVAAMQGQTVVVDKKKNNFFTGGKGAGFTFW